MKNEKVKLTKLELEDHFNEQIDFLRNSCDSYDNGFKGESKRIAVTLRVLLHDAKYSHSVLGQLKKKDNNFLSTSIPIESKSLSPHNGLVMIGVKGKESIYLAMLDETPYKRWLPFDDWWTEPIIVDDRRNKLTREKLIRTVSNQDGGAHVDPELDKTYSRLSKGISLGVHYQEGEEIFLLKRPELAAIRQIGHEVLKSLLPEYSKKQTEKVDMFIGGATTVVSNQEPFTRTERKIGRNDPCFCDSGKKYKYCHGINK